MRVQINYAKKWKPQEEKKEEEQLLFSFQRLPFFIAIQLHCIGPRRYFSASCCLDKRNDK